MATCTNNFVITKGVDNTFVFTIKADGSTLPITIDSTDTFSAQLKLLSDSSVALTKTLTTIDALSGKVSLVITDLEADVLVSEKGSEVDRYYLKPKYKLIIDCATVANGNFIAKVDEVYVD